MPYLTKLINKKSWFLNFKAAAAKASIANFVGTTIPATDAAAQSKSNSANPLEEDYIVIENPLEANGMVRVMESFNQNARVLAWISLFTITFSLYQSPLSSWRIFSSKS